jgi:hypothetical protein
MKIKKKSHESTKYEKKCLTVFFKMNSKIPNSTLFTN